MLQKMHRARQPDASLARNQPPRIIAKEPIPQAFKARAPEPYRMDLDAVLSRPQDSWSDPNAYNIAFDVFSYPAAPMMLGPREQIVLVPPTGSRVAPHHGHENPPPAGHGTRYSRKQAA